MLEQGNIFACAWFFSTGNSSFLKCKLSAESLAKSCSSEIYKLQNFITKHFKYHKMIPRYTELYSNIIKAEFHTYKAIYEYQSQMTPSAE